MTLITHNSCCDIIAQIHKDSYEKETRIFYDSRGNTTLRMINHGMVKPVHNTNKFRSTNVLGVLFVTENVAFQLFVSFIHQLFYWNFINWVEHMLKDEWNRE